MIPELDAIINDLEAAMRGPALEQALPDLLRRSLLEMQRLRDHVHAVDNSQHRAWNAIHKLASAVDI